MSQIEYTADTSMMEPALRRENYLRWRQRLADRQEELRSLGEDPEPTANPEWSPDSLFRTDDATTAPAEVVSSDAAASDLAPVTAISPGLDDGWDRSEVAALLRQFRASAGSPRAASRAVGEAGRPTRPPV